MEILVFLGLVLVTLFFLHTLRSQRSKIKRDISQSKDYSLKSLSYIDKKLANEPEPKKKLDEKAKPKVTEKKEPEKAKAPVKKAAAKKPTRKVWHVVPADKKGWLVKAEGAKTGKKYTTKADAVKAAKVLGKAAKLGQVIVHKKDGKIQKEFTYGADPKRSKG